MKRLIVAKSAGFCFGVKRAVDTVYEQAKKKRNRSILTDRSFTTKRLWKIWKNAE